MPDRSAFVLSLNLELSLIACERVIRFRTSGRTRLFSRFRSLLAARFGCCAIAPAFSVCRTRIRLNMRRRKTRSISNFTFGCCRFFLGMRLTTTEAGFLDATPVKPGKLVDFVLVGRSIEHAVELAERFWVVNRGEPRHTLRFEAAVHALFLGQNPQSLQFERFIYLYTAIDACYKLGESLGILDEQGLKRPIHLACGAHLAYVQQVRHANSQMG